MFKIESDVSNLSYYSIKNDYLYLVLDSNGMIQQNDAGHGFYQQDTRFMNHWDIRLNGTLPLTLLSSIDAGYMATFVYTNRELPIEVGGQPDPKEVIPQETIQIKRTALLGEIWSEKYQLVNYFKEPITLSVSWICDADFRDIFEVRHLSPDIHGTHDVPEANKNGIRFSYTDGSGQELVSRVVFCDFIPEIMVMAQNQVIFTLTLTLAPLETRHIHLEIIPEGPPGLSGASQDFDSRLRTIDQRKTHWKNQVTEFCSDNEDFNEILGRTTSDLQMLLTPDWWTESGRDGNTPAEYFIAAGVPWFSTLFGRDSIITARDCLILNPNLARTTLNILAYFQGKEENPEKDEEPGKILHELRTGELARMELIPHTPYYGSADATPLWLILLHDYVLWTRDFDTLNTLWPNALKAMEWIQNNLSRSPNGFLYYEGKSQKGLYHQGWKDSHDSAMYEDGTPAETPLSLVEIQGYVFMAMSGMAKLAERRGEADLSSKLNDQAKRFQKAFEEAFWMEDLCFYAMGLDKNNVPLRVISSNPGHCLETGIMDTSRSQMTMTRLMEPDMFSGWGIRTLSSKMPSYNPMSYHNGSIWPHDNAMIARGFSRLGQHEYTEKLFRGLFEAARHIQHRGLPELFCGFVRDEQLTDPPVRYPVACTPQAWAASSILSLLQSILNIQRNWESDNLIIKRPNLPAFLDTLHLRRIPVSHSNISLEFKRSGNNIVVSIPERTNGIEVVIEM